MSLEQSRYQVRFDWGYEGAAAIGSDADVLVWVDTIITEPLDISRIPDGAAVVRATIGTAHATASWLLRQQTDRATRITIAVVAAGAARAGNASAAGVGAPGGVRAEGSLRFAVEDFLAAGAVIDRLAALGIDAVSPEAAASEAAYSTLRGAVRHLVTASVTAGETAPDASTLKVDPTLGADDAIVVRL